MVVGPTGSGKTYWIKQLLEKRDVMIDPAPMKIIWFYRRWQPCYTALQEQMTIEFIEGIPSNINRDDFFDASIPTLFIIDDLMKEATQNADICNLFTEGSHHRNLSVICVLQNLYYKGKENRLIKWNGGHFLMLIKSSLLIYVWEKLRSRLLIGSLQTDIHLGFSL